MTVPTRRAMSGVLRDVGRMPYRERVLNLPKPSPVDIDGLLAFHAATFGDARMDGEGAAGAGQAGETGGQATGGATLTQADVNAIVAREADKAKNAALSQVATDLGVTLEEAKQIIADRKSADDAQKTQAQRDADAAAAAKADADRLKNEAATERHHARLERALSKAGLDVDNGVLLRAGLAAIDVPADADAAAVTAAVDKLKTDAPALFGASTGGSGGTHSDAGGQRPKEPKTGGEFGSRGAQEAARRWNTGKSA